MPFVYLHAAWFTIWILLSKGAFGDAAVFDPYPFGLLTTIVSLEAIFLSTFVMISQNRQAAREDIRAEVDFETNLRSEVWSVHIGKALGLDAEAVERRGALLRTAHHHGSFRGTDDGSCPPAGTTGAPAP
nr:DUF1003 domain-containing protein [Frankia sp. Mgl5]